MSLPKRQFTFDVQAEAMTRGCVQASSRLKELTLHEMGNAEHIVLDKIRNDLVTILDACEERQSLTPLLTAIDESDKRLEAGPNKASTSVWSHALSGVAGYLLNFTLPKIMER